MPKFRDNIGAISKGAMVMMCIMFSYLGNLITSDEILSKKILDIGIDWIRVKHSTPLYDYYLRNIIRTAIIVPLTSYNVAIFKRIKWKLQQLLVTYLEVVCTTTIVTYRSIVESGRLIETFNQNVIIDSPLKNKNFSQIISTYLDVVCTVIIVTFCSIVEPGQLIETVNQNMIIEFESANVNFIQFINTYLEVVYSIIIVTCCSMIESGRIIETISRKILSRLESDVREYRSQMLLNYPNIIINPFIVTVCSIIVPGRLSRTIYQDLIILIETENYKLQVLYTYLKVVNIIGIVTLGSIISSGKLIETVKNYIMYLWVLNFSKIITIRIDHYQYIGCTMGQFKRFYCIVISIYGAGQFIKTVQIYSACLLMYNHSSMIIIPRNQKYYITQTLNCIDRLYLLGQITNVFFTLFISRSYVAKHPQYIAGLFAHIREFITWRSSQARKFPIDRATVTNPIAEYTHKKSWQTDNGLKTEISTCIVILLRNI